MEWNRKDLLGLEELTKEEINLILDTAESFKEVSLRPVKKVPALRGKTVVLFFFEPSTRTRTSFELAAKRLSADMVNISASGSSVVKGESLKDTIRNIEAMKVDIIVMRHFSSGAPHILAKAIEPSVVNAGDGCHEHPTQALLDIFTIKEKKGKIEGLNVTIIGDILHSRVARSNIWGLTKLGANVTVCGPPTLMPPGIERMGARPVRNGISNGASPIRNGISNGVKATFDMKEALAGADVAIMLRIQLERQKEKFFPSLREYAINYGLDADKLKYAKKDILIMHPGPVNRGVEISSEVADGPYSVILQQVTNGIAVRMAVLYLVSGAGR